MSEIKKYTLEVMKPVYAILDPEQNKRIVETAGFVPLDVKLKRFEQAGLAAQFNTSEFTANDFRQLYANPDFEIYPDDEFEEVQEKIDAYNQFRNEYLKKLKDGAFAESKSPSQQAQRASKQEQQKSEQQETGKETVSE